ncbi:SpvB-domain-containing protein [Westerdykella ornata]|uniref:SpvB-domain-containing protein n=1 Tax=Westerdykella ornata TaxID=318751 RepID=A0A6A6JUN2_WESOR|nr:SpvB-domain-containing protein [Westerdykella ornata]KAF2279528.1 SpvB-domain-containing protein [Westerdykella ornata]
MSSTNDGEYGTRQTHRGSGNGQHDPTGSATTPKTSTHSAPSISIPKGGGAIRGIGEKFGANPVTGTGKLSVPIATSSGRSGFGPQLSLSYDSGEGNGPFGIGWNLSLPSITRKTDQGLPRYHDAEESDVFILAGSEDLVPRYKQDKEGNCIRDELGSLVFDEVDRVGYTVRRYSPRIEGMFARIERWTRRSDSDVHWRLITPDNVTSLYGKDARSRISSPTDPLNRVFSWLICESYDSKGNTVVYDYKQEDSVGVPLAGPSEHNRTDQSRSSNRYPKTIKYGNRKPNRDQDSWKVTDPTLLPDDSWMFKVVFDYGEHALDNPKPDHQNSWTCRADPFSSYRAGFEVRTYRLCRRILLFHCFPEELGTKDYLVRSTDFAYSEDAISSFITSVTQSGYVRHHDGYLKKSMPALELEYSKAPDPDRLANLPVQYVDTENLENVPYGVDNTLYEWLDLDGEGLSGIFTAQAEGWFYKRNLSANNLVCEDGDERAAARFSPSELVTAKPVVAEGQIQFIDLQGNGQIDIVQMEGPARGFYERINDIGWSAFRPFASWPNANHRDPNLRFVDLNGDGHADILITENEVFTWYPSLAEEGFGPAERVFQPSDEEKGARLLFVDGTQSIYLADFSGDGLMDLAQIRNGKVCYWPNLGYGRFGAKVTMDHSPWFTSPDKFSQERIRLADIDGSGPTDIIYLQHDSVDIYRNQAGNGWAPPERITVFPHIDNLSSVTAIDLLGIGTVCLVWSSPLPADVRRMYYLDLMDGQKPHLLVKMVNNLGAETRVIYAPSTRFYLQDKQDGKPWITPLPFPVHCVERIELHDRISQNLFVTRYAYHHGYFDGVEREFRGFGMVEQWDTEEFAVLNGNSSFPNSLNVDESSHTPPVYTKSWFHTGAHVGTDAISKKMAREYYGAGRLNDDQFEEFLKTLLDDTVLPHTVLTADETREAYRALKGSLLRQEIYANDGGDDACIPYSVSEINHTVESVQPQNGNSSSIFFTHPRESISYHYERNPQDPRVQHQMTLEVNRYGNVLKSVAIGYGRQQGRSTLGEEDDRARQERLIITYTENDFTNAVDEADDYHTPVSCEVRTYQVTGFTAGCKDDRLNLATFNADNFGPIRTLDEIPYEQDSNPMLRQKRLIERSRMLYRSNDLTRLLPIGQLESLVLPGERYMLALTPGLISNVFQRKHGHQPTENLLPNPASILGGQGNNQAGYVDMDNDSHWWVPGGRMFLHPDAHCDSHQELVEARRHFFSPRRFTDAFNRCFTVDYDEHFLLPVRTTDALGNVVQSANDYRVLQPKLITDPNGNRKEAAYDALGMLVGTAVMGKASENLGDSLTAFRADLSQAEVNQFFTNPTGSAAAALLGSATMRIIYYVNRFSLGADSEEQPQPSFTAALVRETHASDLLESDELKIQVAFSYSDGYGREIQKKVQAKADHSVKGGGQRWVGSGWTIFNNKGSPIKQYEPFFDDSHDFRFDRRVGSSSTLLYDPLQRLVATLHPDHTWEKMVYDPWHQKTYDANDTVLRTDPRTDVDVGHCFQRLLETDYLPTWYEARKNGQRGPREEAAASKAASHADTPTVAHFDTLGRTFLTIADNGAAGSYTTRVLLDIEGNERQVVDAKGRVIVQYDYDMLGTRIRQTSMEAGERWTVVNAVGNALLAWNSRHHRLRHVYDPLHRPKDLYLREGDGPELLVERVVYGETQPEAEIHNQRQQVVQVFDQAGIVTNNDYDFKGNLLRSQRQLAQNYTTTLDWSTHVPLEDPLYIGSTTYDALSRTKEVTAPENSVIRHIYNEGNRLEQVWVQLRGEQKDGEPIWTPFVTSIDHDAKGQRTRIEYGNGTSTAYSYDPLTFRLINIRTLRRSDTLQDLQYTYDPVGNTTHIHDNAQQTILFRNQRVEPSTDFTYDAIYQLIAATGREHLGQTNGKPNAPTASGAFDSFRTRLESPGNGDAMGTYIEKYTYDAVGNILAMKHRGSDPSHPGWTRTYCHNERSQLEADKVSNRLTSTSVKGTMEIYRYDGTAGMHGNMTAMPHLSLMQWDHKDQLRATARQSVKGKDNCGVPETTWYVYDASGQRVRKVTERQGAAGQTATRLKERIYVGGFEVYRKYGGDGSTIALERETLHIMDDKQRIALVETRTQGDEPRVPQQLTRYQLSNHLGTAGLELDGQGQIISYEEYYPFGGTSYQAVRSKTETPKRYGYTGKERDEENGLYYHGARYYAPWLGRWTSSDPVWETTNLYTYVRNNPVRYHDPDGRADEPGIWETIRDSGPFQYMSGIAMGAGSSFIPGGFLISPVGQGTGVLNKPSRLFEAGYGAAEMVAGGFQMIVGGGGEVLGFGLDATGAGAVIGIPINVASAGVLVQGAGNFTAGFGNLSHAIMRDPDPPKQSTTTTSKPSEPASNPVEKPPPRAEPAEPPSKPAPSKPPQKTPKPRGSPKPQTPTGPLRTPNMNSEVATLLADEQRGLTTMANEIKKLGQLKGVTIEIALVTLRKTSALGKKGQQILVAGINSGFEAGFNAKQLAKLKEWGINVAPQYAKEMKALGEGAPHAEANIVSYMKEIGARGVRWSNAVVGKPKWYRASDVCDDCRAIIEGVGGRIEERMR